LSTTTAVLAFAAMIILAVADFSTKQSAGKISPSLGTLIYAATTVAIPLVWTIWSNANGGVQVSRDGVIWSIVTGLSFSLFTGTMFVLFSSGINLSIGSPVIRTGALIMAATLGIVFLRENLNWQYVIGFVLAIVGILLVATR
jgi:uncharacterized membrane protein